MHVKMSSIHLHNWIDTTFVYPLLCSACKRMIFGLPAKGARCQRCHKKIHRKCCHLAQSVSKCRPAVHHSIMAGVHDNDDDDYDNDNDNGGMAISSSSGHANTMTLQVEEGYVNLWELIHDDVRCRWPLTVILRNERMYYGAENKSILNRGDMLILLHSSHQTILICSNDDDEEKLILQNSLVQLSGNLNSRSYSVTDFAQRSLLPASTAVMTSPPVGFRAAMPHLTTGDKFIVKEVEEGDMVAFQSVYGDHFGWIPLFDGDIYVSVEKSPSETNMNASSSFFAECIIEQMSNRISDNDNSVSNRRRSLSCPSISSQILHSSLLSGTGTGVTNDNVANENVIRVSNRENDDGSYHQRSLSASIGPIRSMPWPIRATPIEPLYDDLENENVSAQVPMNDTIYDNDGSNTVDRVSLSQPRVSDNLPYSTVVDDVHFSGRTSESNDDQFQNSVRLAAASVPNKYEEFSDFSETIHDRNNGLPSTSFIRSNETVVPSSRHAPELSPQSSLGMEPHRHSAVSNNVDENATSFSFSELSVQEHSPIRQRFSDDVNDMLTMRSLSTGDQQLQQRRTNLVQNRLLCQDHTYSVLDNTENNLVSTSLQIHPVPKQDIRHRMTLPKRSMKIPSPETSTSVRPTSYSTTMGTIEDSGLYEVVPGNFPQNGVVDGAVLPPDRKSVIRSISSAADSNLSISPWAIPEVTTLQNQASIELSTSEGSITRPEQGLSPSCVDGLIVRAARVCSSHGGSLAASVIHPDALSILLATYMKHRRKNNNDNDNDADGDGGCNDDGGDDNGDSDSLRLPEIFDERTNLHSAKMDFLTCKDECSNPISQNEQDVHIYHSRNGLTIDTELRYKYLAELPSPSLDPELKSLLTVAGVEEYGPILCKERIDLAALTLCSDRDLAVIGIGLGPRRKILAALSNNKDIMNSVLARAKSSVRRMKRFSESDV